MDKACLGDCSHPMIQRTVATGKERLLRAVRDVAASSHRLRFAPSLTPIITVGPGELMIEERKRMLFSAWGQQPRPAQVALAADIVVEDFASLEAGGAGLSVIGDGRTPITLWVPPPSPGELNLPQDLEREVEVDLGQCGHFLAPGESSGTCIICQDALATQRSFQLSCGHSYHEVNNLSPTTHPDMSPKTRS
eukprot:874382-Amphidinium_carterae.1